MGPLTANVNQVQSFGRRVLQSNDLTAEHHPVGFGNENWILHSTDGSRYILKIGDHASAAKWRSSHTALELARTAGLQVPELIHVGDLDSRLARIFTWIDGTTASDVDPGSAQSNRLMHSTGAAVRALHSIRRDEFSSRLDDSSPAFPSWKSYIDHRLSQIRARCEKTDAVEAGVLDRACSLAARLAGDVDHVAEAVVCHRDLHPDNLIVNGDGELVGIIDWDAAEAWDRAGDWFKLEFDLLTAHPRGADVLNAAYFRSDPIPDNWLERRRIVHIIESLNILPNAIARNWTKDFFDRASTHLLDLLE